MSQPVITFTDGSGSTITTLGLTGGGFANAVVAGQASNVAAIRIYNNKAGASSILDAINCVLAVYDTASAQGSALTVPVTQLYLQAQVTSYDGVTTGADTGYTALGGSVKHAVPVNGGTIAGGAAHYIGVNTRVVLPPTAASASVTQGLWLEYSWVG